MTTAALQRFAELHEKRTKLKAEVKTIETEIDGLKDPVLEHLIDAGQQSVKLDNGRLVFIHRQLWAGKTDEDMSGAEIVTALQASGLGDLGTANWSSLSAFCRELNKDDDGMPILPDGLAGVIKVTERIEPRSRKAS